jgi:hypothetical protein
MLHKTWHILGQDYHSEIAARTQASVYKDAGYDTRVHALPFGKGWQVKVLEVRNVA